MLDLRPSLQAGPTNTSPSCLFSILRNSKPRNRPSFRQILLHLDIASADVLSTPQETYFKSQVDSPSCRCYQCLSVYSVFT